MKEPSGLSVIETIFLFLIMYAIGMLMGVLVYSQLSIKPMDVYRGKPYEVFELCGGFLCGVLTAGFSMMGSETYCKCCSCGRTKRV